MNITMYRKTAERCARNLGSNQVKFWSNIFYVEHFPEDAAHQRVSERVRWELELRRKKPSRMHTCASIAVNTSTVQTAQRERENVIHRDTCRSKWSDGQGLDKVIECLDKVISRSGIIRRLAVRVDSTNPRICFMVWRFAIRTHMYSWFAIRNQQIFEY